jgi:hypothetical protein
MGGRLNTWLPGLALTAAFLAGPVLADDVDDEPRGVFEVGFQFIHTDGFQGTQGELPIGTTDARSINFDVHYRVGERWSFELGIPLISKRYRGPGPHVPALLDPPRDAPFIDTGSYHTYFQDWRIGASYRLRDVPFGLGMEAFAAFGVPSTDYPFFAQSAVGQNLNKFDVGVAFSYVPPLSDAYYQLDISRVFVEETLGVSIDHWRVNGEIGYFFSRHITGYGFFMLKEGDGQEFPDDFPPPRTTEWWYQHDRMVKHNYINVGLGMLWALNDRYRLDLSALTMAHADQVHIMKYAFNISLSRSF